MHILSFASWRKRARLQSYISAVTAHVGCEILGVILSYSIELFQTGKGSHISSKPFSENRAGLRLIINRDDLL